MCEGILLCCRLRVHALSRGSCKTCFRGRGSITFLNTRLLLGSPEFIHYGSTTEWRTGSILYTAKKNAVTTTTTYHRHHPIIQYYPLTIISFFWPSFTGSVQEWSCKKQTTKQWSLDEWRRSKKETPIHSTLMHIIYSTFKSVLYSAVLQYYI